MIIKFIGDNTTLNKATVVYEIGIKIRNYVKEGNNTSAQQFRLELLPTWKHYDIVTQYLSQKH